MASVRSCAQRLRWMSTACTVGAPTHVDVAIVGGGAIGQSTAFWLKTLQPALSVGIIERDSRYQFASSPRSVGGIRSQFTNSENVLLSLYSAQFLRDVSKHLGVADAAPVLGQAPTHLTASTTIDVGFREHGYLFLATKLGVPGLKAAHATQVSHGASTALLPPAALQARFPWLNVEDIELGTFGEQLEGSFDPWLLLQAFKTANKRLGVHTIHGSAVAFTSNRTQTDTKPESAASSHAGASTNTNNAAGSPIRVHSVTIEDGSNARISLGCDKLVVAAGAWSGQVAAAAGLQGFPVEPRKRIVFAFESRAGGEAIAQAPLVVDPLTGVYFRQEGGPHSGRYLAGVSPSLAAERASRAATATSLPHLTAICEGELSVSGEEHSCLWEETIWPALAARVPAFDACKVTNSWAGYYDYNTFDQNALIGAHRAFANVYFNTGFSGHGIMQAPASGRALAELMVEGGYSSVDVRRMRPDRYLDGELLLERNIV